MSKRESLYLIAASALTASVIVTACLANKLSHKLRSDSVIEQARLVRDTHLRERLSRPYGKTEIPAEVYIGLAQSEDSRKPVEIVISATTAIPTSLARIMLITPQEGTETEHKETLWADTLEGHVDKTIIYKGGNLPEGRHQYVAVLEFLTDSDNPELLAATGSLYLDVRRSAILSSNVSFEQIEREELYKELEKQVVVSMRPQLMNTSSKVLARETIALESADPGIIDREIKELIASDPDVAKRIDQLNTLTESTSESSELKSLSTQSQPDMERTSAPIRYGSPISDVPVPVPEKFRNRQ